MTGIGESVTVAIVLMTLFSNGIATAQMMMSHQQMQRSTPNQGMGYSSIFNSMGMSMVPDVRITGISIVKDNELAVNLTYTGNGSAPSITVVAMTNHMAMMNMMMGMGGFIGNNMSSVMIHSSMLGMANMGMMMGSNSSGIMMDGTHSGMAMNSQIGSTVIENGWQPGRAINIKLEGNGSAFEASDLCVMVFPHIT